MPVDQCTSNVYTLHIESIAITKWNGALTKEKKRKKANQKDSQLVIRINGEERDRFVSLCEDLDSSAAREIRRFIRKFVKEHEHKGE